MRAPSKNITESLKSQMAGKSGRGTFAPAREEMGGTPSMTVPGDGQVQTAPGAHHSDRSAVAAADAMGNRGKMG